MNTFFTQRMTYWWIGFLMLTVATAATGTRRTETPPLRSELPGDASVVVDDGVPF